MRLHGYFGCDATKPAELVRNGEVAALEPVELVREAHAHARDELLAEEAQAYVDLVEGQTPETEAASPHDLAEFCAQPRLFQGAPRRWGVEVIR